jgi:hypothetical protein
MSHASPLGDVLLVTISLAWRYREFESRASYLSPSCSHPDAPQTRPLQPLVAAENGILPHSKAVVSRDLGYNLFQPVKGHCCAEDAHAVASVWLREVSRASRSSAPEVAQSRTPKVQSGYSWSMAKLYESKDLLGRKLSLPSIPTFPIPGRIA